MAGMGKYCKAYLVKDFRAFPGWRESLDSLRPDNRDDDEAPDIERTRLEDEDVLYLQENYVVTDGIFIDEHIIFDDVTDEWIAFCDDHLEFEIPVFASDSDSDSDSDDGTADRG